MPKKDEALTTEQPQTQASQADQLRPQAAADNSLAKIAELEEQLEQAQQERDQKHDEMLRAAAEAQNTVRRTQLDLSNARANLIKGFTQELLPVIDSIEQGLGSAESNEATQALREGMEMTLNLLLKAMEKYGIQQLNPVGEEFNPELHEALTMQPHAEAKSNTVIEVFQKGYSLNDRVIRPARVIVAQ